MSVRRLSNSLDVTGQTDKGPMGDHSQKRLSSGFIVIFQNHRHIVLSAVLLWRVQSYGALLPLFLFIYACNEEVVFPGLGDSVETIGRRRAA
jgi:hypothetical protein